MWQQFQVPDHKTLYQDNNLIMGSWNRPLPGVRLGERRKYNNKRETHCRTQILLEILSPDVNGTYHHPVGPISSTTILGLRHGRNPCQIAKQGP